MDSRARIGATLEAALPATSVILFLLLWEMTVRWYHIAPIILPPPSSIAIYLWAMLVDGTMEYNLALTMIRILAGFITAAIAGVALGLAMGMSRLIARIADVWIVALYPLPKI